MADLHETLEQRERQSKIVSFLVGSAIILAVVVGVVWFNSRNDDSGQVVDEGVSITVTEDNQSQDDSSAVQPEADSDEQTAPVADTGDDDQIITTPDQSSDSSDSVANNQTTDQELPNTGPAEAVIGLVAVVVATTLFVQARSKLDAGLSS